MPCLCKYRVHTYPQNQTQSHNYDAIALLRLKTEHTRVSDTLKNEKKAQQNAQRKPTCPKWIRVIFATVSIKNNDKQLLKSFPINTHQMMMTTGKDDSFNMFYQTGGMGALFKRLFSIALCLFVWVCVYSIPMHTLLYEKSDCLMTSENIFQHIPFASRFMILK